MANTFKCVTFAAEPASAGTPYTMYTVASSTTTVILGLILTNIHTTSVTVTIVLLVEPVKVAPLDIVSQLRTPASVDCNTLLLAG